MPRQTGLVMLGDGGHAVACCDLVESLRDYSISMGGRVHVGFVVPDTKKLTPVDWMYLSEHYDGYILGVGMIHSGQTRAQIAEQVIASKGRFVTLISPFARVSPKSTIGEGTIVMPSVSINAGAVIKELCIINTGAIVEHNAVIHQNCHISTGAVINGDCIVGSDCFIGSNAVLLNQIQVCPDTTIGAGSVVTRHITEQGGIYAGNPTSLLRRKP